MSHEHHDISNEHHDMSNEHHDISKEHRAVLRTKYSYSSFHVFEPHLS
ncbi:hypothetical protein [Nostoc sp.]